MRLETESRKEEWYEGVISSYNGLTGKYGLYFPCGGKTEDASFDDEDMKLIQHNHHEHLNFLLHQ